MPDAGPREHYLYCLIYDDDSDRGGLEGRTGGGGGGGGELSRDGTLYLHQLFASL